VLIVGSNLRKDHPLFAQRIRQAARKGAQVSSINSSLEIASRDAWAMRVANLHSASPSGWLQALADIAAAIGAESNVAVPGFASVTGEATDTAKLMALSLLGGERKAILLGNAAAHHVQASRLLEIAQWIGEQTGASVGYLTEAANTVGAQWAGALPGQGGLDAGQMLAPGNPLKAVLLLNNEPAFDSIAGPNAVAAFDKVQMVVTMSPFKTNLDISDVLLPMAPFSETSGTFVNAEGRVQSFHAVVKPRGDARPAWKVLRVLANMLGLPGFDFESSQDVLNKLRGAQPDAAATHVPSDRLSNAVEPQADAASSADAVHAIPLVASIYQLDGLVRRATSLQLTADGRHRPQAVQGTRPTLDGVPA